MKRGGAVLGVLAVLIGVGLFVTAESPPRQPIFGGMTCVEVMQVAERFVERELDAVTTRHVEEHLNLCPHCRATIEKIRAGQGDANDHPAAMKGVIDNNHRRVAGGRLSPTVAIAAL